MEIKNGRRTSLWYESWSSLGCLKDILNGGGCIDMGIPINATVEESRGSIEEKIIGSLC